MKKLNYICVLIAFAFATSSCKKEINGSGNFIVQNRTSAPFTEVTSCGDFNIILKEDTIPGIELYGENNILPEIETEVIGTELKIYYKSYKYNYDHNGVTITIRNPAFTGIDLQGSGNISSREVLNSNSLRVNLSGSGTIDLAVTNATLTSNISGSGKIYLLGSATTAKHTISGSGKIKAFDLQSKVVNANISGSGDCEINVIEKLYATISGSGNIKYRGNPVVVKNISGSGSVGHE